MPSIFATLEDAVSDEIDRLFAEYFEHRPMTQRPNVGASSDVDRSVLRVVGIFDARTEEMGQIPASMLSPGAKSENGFVSIDDRQFDGPRPRKGDHFLRVDTGEVFEVSSFDDDGLGRRRYRLRHVGLETVA